MRSEDVQRDASTASMLTISEVSRILRVHPNSVRRWANQGLIKAYRVGSRGDRRFMADDVSRFLQAEESFARPVS